MGVAPTTTRIAVEVAYALPGQQRLVRLLLDAGAAAEDALQASGLFEEFPELRTMAVTLGIHGRVVPGSQRMQDCDRLEIYRALTADPKLARRKRAAKLRKN